jgi:hypothetical protein
MAINTVTQRNTLATAYGTAGAYIGLLSALTLQGAISIGAVSFSSDLSVAVGDTVVFDQGLSTQEARVVSAVTGTGPYAVTVPATTFAHSAGALISHLPAAATGHELVGGAYARVASGWGSVDNSAIVSTPTPINVPIGAKVGSVAIFSAISAGAYLDASAVAGQFFATAGTYTPTYTYTQV